MAKLDGVIKLQDFGKVPIELCIIHWGVKRRIARTEINFYSLLCLE